MEELKNYKNSNQDFETIDEGTEEHAWDAVTLDFDKDEVDNWRLKLPVFISIFAHFAFIFRKWNIVYSEMK